MKKRYIFASLLMLIMMTSCGTAGEPEDSSVAPEAETAAGTISPETQAETTAPETEAETSEKMTAPVEEVGYEGMTAVYADALKDGEYTISVDSSSSMFNILGCQLFVENGAMTAKMTMSGMGYLYLYMGTGEEAASASEESYIPFEETNGVHCFTVPVEALDKEIDCAAFSKKKEEWYDRKLVFRADGLPADAFAEGAVTSAESLALADGVYTVDVTLEGGSGKASVRSPAKLTVTGGQAVAELIWSSNSYDYMMVDGEKYLPTSMEENSIFEIPVTVFDRNMPVSADTTAMSTPHEIEYTLYFDSASVTAQ